MGSDRRIGSALVVDNDGLHARTEKSSTLPLAKGRQPFTVAWFARDAPPALDVYYEGPNVPRQRLPGAALYFGPGHGVAWSAYQGDWWQLPDFIF